VIKSDELSNPEERRIYRIVGTNIWGARNGCGMSQEKLARKIGLKRTSVTNIEAGRQRLSVHMLVKIAAALNVTVEELL
jgi:DNA-binding XRE family transcriptional regulator